MSGKSNKRINVLFIIVLIAAVGCLIGSFVMTDAYNKTKHTATFTGSELFSPEDTKSKEVSIAAVPRSGTWSKVIDPDNKGLTEHNFQAYTYDFTVANNTEDQVADFSFKMIFSKDVYLATAWNGALEIHQNVGANEVVSTVKDLREFKPDEHPLATVNVDGESFIPVKKGDYIIYIPCSDMSAMEVPIEPKEGTTPGIIMYVAIGEELTDSVLELEYTFNRKVTSEPLFWVSIVLFGLWVVALITFIITSAQVKKYKKLHERDNKIISESIETFTGFIDAKDTYTNGHSKRVAMYTKLIAEEMGYEDEALDHIYYIALLHDCGKIGVPDNILGKPGRLTDEEFEVIKGHTVRGGEILKNFKSLENAGEGALYHHERYDGKGYPEGRSGEDIPIIARIICVADSFDAMNSNRCYRQKLSSDHIISELESNKGRQFDPKVAEVMLRLIREGKVVIEG